MLENMGFEVDFLESVSESLKIDDAEIKAVGVCQLPLLQAWSDIYLPTGKWKSPILLLAVKRNLSVIAFIPLARQKISFFTIQSLAGFYWPYRSFFITHSHAGSNINQPDLAAIDLLSSHFKHSIMRFGPISNRDKAMNYLFTRLIAGGWVCISRDNGNVYGLDLSVGKDYFMKNVSSSLIKNIEYSKRRLNRDYGTLKIKRYVNTYEDSLLDTLEFIERKSWVGINGGDVKFSGEKNKQYWRQCAQNANKNVEIVFWVLNVCDEPVAFSAHIEIDSCIYIVANSYVESWKSHSLGSILTYEVIKDAFDRDITLVDWGQGDSGYKQRWGATIISSLSDNLLLKPGVLSHLISKIIVKFSTVWKIKERLE